MGRLLDQESSRYQRVRRWWRWKTTADKFGIILAILFLGVPWLFICLPCSYSSPVKCSNLVFWRAFAYVKPEKARDAFVRAVKDGDSSVRETAVTYLGSGPCPKDSATVTALIWALADTDPKVRELSAKTLALVKDSRSVEPLIAKLKDKEQRVRESAAVALGAIGDLRAVDPLINALMDWDTRTVACNSLSKLGWSPGSDRERVCFWVARHDLVSVRNNLQTIRAVLLQFLTSSETAQIAYASKVAIGLADQQLIPELLKVLKDKSVAEVYLNSGNDELRKAAQEWARRNGFSIRSESGSASVVWASFR